MKNKDNLVSVVLIVVLVLGLCMVLYPTFSNYWNSSRQTQVISTYEDAVSDMDKEDFEQYYYEASEYNKKLHENFNPNYLSDTQMEEYMSVLNFGDNGLMGYVDIPSINSSMPIYHGTENAVLQVAVGHLDWTSLPIGGAGSHAVLIGHRGLPSAKLFTDIDKMVEGDVFYLHILDKTLTYEVDKISIIEPDDTSLLGPEKGKDLCTLVTCTPYAINTHRLLVRGHRIENEIQGLNVRITSNAVQIKPVAVTAVLAGVLFMVLLFITYLSAIRIKNKKQALRISLNEK